MAAGLVPVVSDIPSGVPEIVDGGSTACDRRSATSAAFAGAIAGSIAIAVVSRR